VCWVAKGAEVKKHCQGLKDDQNRSGKKRKQTNHGRSVSTAIERKMVAGVVTVANF